jgi:hypothetical protein
MRLTHSRALALVLLVAACCVFKPETPDAKFYKAYKSYATLHAQATFYAQAPEADQMLVAEIIAIDKEGDVVVQSGQQARLNRTLESDAQLERATAALDALSAKLRVVNAKAGLPSIEEK